MEDSSNSTTGFVLQTLKMFKKDISDLLGLNGSSVFV